MSTKKRFLQGRYIPKNPEKYVGDLNKIVYRSSYELQMHQFLDNNTKVLKWASEEIVIPYFYIVDGRMHRYFPDYWVQYQNMKGEVITELLEVKPLAQTKPPRKNSKYALYEQATYAKNVCKWTAAKKWCDERGWKFRIITERSIFR